MERVIHNIVTKAYAINSHSMLDSVSQILRKTFTASHLLVIQFRRGKIRRSFNI